MADNDVSSRSAFANGYVSGCIETMTMVAETLRDSSNLPHAVLRASMILKRMRNDPDELRRRIYAMIDGGASSVDDPRDAEIAQLRAENARFREAMPSERLLSELEESIDEWDGYTDMQKHARDWVVKARLARLDAAKGVR